MTPTTRPPKRIAVHGAAGRMGIRIMQLIRDDPRTKLVAALDRPGHPAIGKDVSALTAGPDFGVTLSDDPAVLDAAQVVIDFSTPEGTQAIAKLCAAKGLAIVVGTTGLEPAVKERLEECAETIPLLVSPNVSRAVNVLMALVKQATLLLPGADVEIVERHHKFKKDAPSGTALRLAEIVAAGIGVGPEAYAHGREGITGERPAGQIGLHALRTGDNPGEHTVVFGLMGECIELSHRALNRDGFARGSIDCAVWLADRPPGNYTMNDVLGI